MINVNFVAHAVTERAFTSRDPCLRERRKDLNKIVQARGHVSHKTEHALKEIIHRGIASSELYSRLVGHRERKRSLCFLRARNVYTLIWRGLSTKAQNCAIISGLLRGHRLPKHDFYALLELERKVRVLLLLTHTQLVIKDPCAYLGPALSISSEIRSKRVLTDLSSSDRHRKCTSVLPSSILGHWVESAILISIWLKSILISTLELIVRNIRQSETVTRFLSNRRRRRKRGIHALNSATNRGDNGSIWRGQHRAYHLSYFWHKFLAKTENLFERTLNTRPKLALNSVPTVKPIIGVLTIRRYLKRIFIIFELSAATRNVEGERTAIV